MNDYSLIDEPNPGPLAPYIVRPFWIFLGLLFAGAWLAFPWFILNAYALGSPSRNREVGVSAAYFAVATIWALLVVIFVAVGLPPTVGHYALAFVVVLKLVAAFSIVALQGVPFERYAEFQPVHPYPALLVGAGWLLKGFVLPVSTFGWLGILRAVLG